MLYDYIVVTRVLHNQLTGIFILKIRVQASGNDITMVRGAPMYQHRSNVGPNMTWSYCKVMLGQCSKWDGAEYVGWAALFPYDWLMNHAPFTKLVVLISATTRALVCAVCWRHLHELNRQVQSAEKSVEIHWRIQCIFISSWYQTNQSEVHLNSLTSAIVICSLACFVLTWWLFTHHFRYSISHLQRKASVHTYDYAVPAMQHA